MTSDIVVHRLPHYPMQQVVQHADAIRPLVRMQSPALTLACRQAGMPMELAEVCGGLLASVVDDLVGISGLHPADFERSKRMERVLEAVREPAVHALRIAMAASPINGRAAVRHWDVVCDRAEVGKLAWLLGMDTENGIMYGKKIARLQNSC